MKNKCIISFIKRVECNYSQETHEKIEKGKQINKRCTSNALHSVRGSALHIIWECVNVTWIRVLYWLHPWTRWTQCSYAFLLRTFCTPVHVSEKIKSAHVTHFSASDWLHPWTRFIIEFTALMQQSRLHVKLSHKEKPRFLCCNCQ